MHVPTAEVSDFALGSSYNTRPAVGLGLMHATKCCLDVTHRTCLDAEGKAGHILVDIEGRHSGALHLFVLRALKTAFPHERLAKPFNTYGICLLSLVLRHCLYCLRAPCATTMAAYARNSCKKGLTKHLLCQGILEHHSHSLRAICFPGSACAAFPANIWQKGLALGKHWVQLICAFRVAWQ